MFEVIPFLIMSIISVSVISYLWYKVQALIYPHTTVYLVPEKNTFIYRQGQYRIIFDSLGIIGEDTSASGDVNTVIVEKYSLLDPAKPHITLARAGKLVAVIPVSIDKHPRIEISLPGENRSRWMTIPEFKEQQAKILQDVKSDAKLK